MVNLKIGQKIVVKIMRLGINGEGIGYYQKRLIFVPYALPDEEVQVEITENQRNFSRARLTKILKRSKYRVEPADKVYADLSSTHIMHLAYPQQLIFKQDLLRQALEKFKPQGYKRYELRPTLGMSNPLRYRYKLTYQLRRLKNGSVIAGLYRENSHHLVSLKDCLVQEDLTQKIANEVCQLIEKFNLPVDDERHARGLKTVMLRRSRARGEIQLMLVSSDDELELPEAFLSALTKKYKDLKTIAINFLTKKTHELYGSKTKILFGPRTIREHVLSIDFGLSPRAFYQLNPEQAEVLYGEAIKALAPRVTDKVIDAYSGVGTIGLALADRVAEVRGMDVTPESIADAKKNAEKLRPTAKTQYAVGAAEKVIPKWFKAGFHADGLIVDPPRTGLDEALLETILRQPPEKMVYVSCNVSTLARDLTYLTQAYRVDYIQSVDMFPHTARTEAVVKLTRQTGKRRK